MMNEVLDDPQAAHVAQEKSSGSSAGGVWEFLKVLIISLVIVLPIRAYVAQPFIVEGDSMLPNFHDGEYLIIDEISYRFQKPKRGEVIVLRSPSQPGLFFIKRIVGLPNEELVIENGTLIVTTASGEGERLLLPEEYLLEGTETVPNVRITLAEDEYFVMGDNRSRSSDSRSWGALPKKNITGRTFLRLWPPSKIGIF